MLANARVRTVGHADIAPRDLDTYSRSWRMCTGVVHLIFLAVELDQASDMLTSASPNTSLMFFLAVTRCLGLHISSNLSQCLSHSITYMYRHLFFPENGFSCAKILSVAGLGQFASDA